MSIKLLHERILDLWVQIYPEDAAFMGRQKDLKRPPLLDIITNGRARQSEMWSKYKAISDLIRKQPAK